MAIYRKGTASLAANGAVTGTGTDWKSPLSLIRVGATVIFLSGSKPVIGSIAEIISDTEMSVINTDGATADDGIYTILLNDGLTVDGLAQDVAETLRYYQSQETAIAETVDLINNINLADLINQMNTIKDAAEAARDAAAESESEAQKWAANPEDSEVEGGLYSSLHYSRKSAASATDSRNSAVDSEASNQASLAHANDSADSASAAEESNQSSAASAAASAQSAANALASEGRINQAISGTFKERGEIGKNGNPSNLDLLNSAGDSGFTGVWKQPSSNNATTANNYPVSAAGALYVNDTVANGVTQTYITIYGDVYVRTRVSGAWQSWSMVGAGYVASDGVDLNALTSAAQIVGSNLVNAPPAIGTSAAFVRVSAQHTGTNARQSVSAPGSNRHFERVKTASSWSDWLELATVKTNGITDVIRGFGNQITLPVDASNPNEAVTLKQMQKSISDISTANSSFSVVKSISSAPAKGTDTEGGLVRSSLKGPSGELGGVDLKYRHTVDPAGVVTKSAVLKVSGGSGEVKITESGGLIFSDPTTTLKSLGLDGSSIPWITPTGANGWSVGSAAVRTGYRKIGGKVQLSLNMTANGPKADGTIIFTIPAGYAPTTIISVHSALSDLTTANRVDVQPDGSVVCQGYSGSQRNLRLYVEYPLEL